MIVEIHLYRVVISFTVLMTDYAVLKPKRVTCLCVGRDLGALACVCHSVPRCALHCIERRSRAFRHSTHGRLRPGLPSAKFLQTTMSPYFLCSHVAKFCLRTPSLVACNWSLWIILRSAQHIQSLVTYGIPGARRLRTASKGWHRAGYDWVHYFSRLFRV